MDATAPNASPTSRKRARTGESITPIENGFVQDPEAGDSGDDDDDDGKPKDKKAGRRKIKIEFIQDKSRRHITFSKRKAGIMKKAYELSTLTGTQVLLLVVSETGLVYTFTTAKLQPLVTQPEGKNLIQSCLNAPAGQPPSSMPVGAPINRTVHQPAVNAPGGLAIGEDDGDESSDGPGGDRPEKRVRRTSADAPEHPVVVPTPPQPQQVQPQQGQPQQVQPPQQQQQPPRPSPIPPPQSLPSAVPAGSPPQPGHAIPVNGGPQQQPQQPPMRQNQPSPYQQGVAGPPGYDPSSYAMYHQQQQQQAQQAQQQQQQHSGYWTGQPQQALPQGQPYPR